MRRSARNIRHSPAHSSTLAASVSPGTRALTGAKSGPTNTRKRFKNVALSDASDDDVDEYVEPESVDSKPKRRKVMRSNRNGQSQQIHQRLFSHRDGQPDSSTCSVPSRVHSIDYHRPILLDVRQSRSALLEWFDGVSTSRSMPWRKPWIDPRGFGGDCGDDDATRREKLARRAYEVWISEIMLQQTRVAVVIDYWNKWMARWPTIQELAAAHPDDVLAAWRGLGYYSRATRIHEASKLVCRDPKMNGLLPSEVDELVANVPGVGRYTAGAIAAIVFGRAAPMVDGNVLRVLSRQLGIYGDVKSDKAVIDLLWAAADSLVKAVAGDSGEHDDMADPDETSDRPGRWGQALMELGSTVCTPKPSCASCPITATCRAYSEGLQLGVQRGLVTRENASPGAKSPSVVDIEDACIFCQPFEEMNDAENGDDVLTGKPAATSDTKPKARKQSTLRSFAFTSSTVRGKAPKKASATLTSDALELITNHARKFPVKVTKKAVRAEETLVCAIRRHDGRYLIHKRPEKGLLAGLWEFPSRIITDTESSTPKTRARDAQIYAKEQMTTTTAGQGKGTKAPDLKYLGELGSVPWLFSHLKLTMHVHLFQAADPALEPHDDARLLPGEKRRWSDDVDAESMGTGMRKCWELVKAAGEC
ncbi:DNA glycosylase [Xylariomycetidae sp. FL2044]|nr:DNA glycosylase [Xylariomycetidae sp. FL2044]